MACDANQLVTAAKCFQCLSGQQLQMVITYLLCQISIGSGGGNVGAISFGHGAPSFTPTTDGAIYFDEDTGAQYNWYAGIWH